MRRLIHAVLVLLVPWLLIGCSLNQPTPWFEKRGIAYHENGFTFFMYAYADDYTRDDSYALRNGLATLQGIGQALEAEARAVAVRYGWPQEQVLALARSFEVLVVDDYKFRAAGFSDQYATGQVVDGAIIVALWSWAKTYDVTTIPPGTPPHLVRQRASDGAWAYPVKPSVPAFDHEVGHAWTGDPTFEH